MKGNSVILSVLCAAVVGGLGIWTSVEHQAGRRLVEEHTILQQQLDQLAGLVAENERLSNLVAQANSSQSLPDDQLRELLRLRGEAGVLRRQAKEFEAVRDENRQAHGALESGLKTQGAGGAGGAATADYWPRDSWAFAGYASPDAALKTSVWAANNGDVKTLLASFTGEMQKMVQKDLEGKSENEASLRAMDEVARLKSIRVVNRDVQADDTVVLTAAFEEGTDAPTKKLVMKKVGNDWKIYGPAQ